MTKLRTAEIIILLNLVFVILLVIAPNGEIVSTKGGGGFPESRNLIGQHDGH